MGVGSAIKHAAERVAGDIDLPEFPPKELENLGTRAKADAGRAEGEGKDKAPQVGDRMCEQVRRGRQGRAGLGAMLHGKQGVGRMTRVIV